MENQLKFQKKEIEENLPADFLTSSEPSKRKKKKKPKKSVSPASDSRESGDQKGHGLITHGNRQDCADQVSNEISEQYGGDHEAVSHGSNDKNRLDSVTPEVEHDDGIPVLDEPGKKRRKRKNRKRKSKNHMSSEEPNAGDPVNLESDEQHVDAQIAYEKKHNGEYQVAHEINEENGGDHDLIPHGDDGPVTLEEDFRPKNNEHIHSDVIPIPHECVDLVGDDSVTPENEEDSGDPATHENCKVNGDGPETETYCGTQLSRDSEDQDDDSSIIPETSDPVTDENEHNNGDSVPRENVEQGVQAIHERDPQEEQRSIFAVTDENEINNDVIPVHHECVDLDGDDSVTPKSVQDSGDPATHESCKGTSDGTVNEPYCGTQLSRDSEDQDDDDSIIPESSDPVTNESDHNNVDSVTRENVEQMVQAIHKSNPQEEQSSIFAVTDGSEINSGDPRYVEDKDQICEDSATADFHEQCLEDPVTLGDDEKGDKDSATLERDEQNGENQVTFERDGQNGEDAVTLEQDVQNSNDTVTLASDEKISEEAIALVSDEQKARVAVILEGGEQNGDAVTPENNERICVDPTNEKPTININSPFIRDVDRLSSSCTAKAPENRHSCKKQQQSLKRPSSSLELRPLKRGRSEPKGVQKPNGVFGTFAAVQVFCFLLICHAVSALFSVFKGKFHSKQARSEKIISGEVHGSNC